MLKGQIREIKQDMERTEQGVYLTVWVQKPHNTFIEGKTEEEIKKKIQIFKKLYAGEIEFQYVEPADG